MLSAFVGFGFALMPGGCLCRVDCRCCCCGGDIGFFFFGEVVERSYNLLETVFAGKDGVFAAIEHAAEHVLLEAQFVDHALFDGVFRHEIDYLNAVFLSVAIDAPNALLEHRGIPR